MSEDDLFLGRKVGQIEITSKLGQGGMGAVYRGMHAFLGKEVAVKFLSKALIENEQFIDRFIREAQTLAHVEHKNLVRVYDAGEWEGNYYIVMEFIKGKSLGDILKTTARIPYKQALSIIRECADGLNAAAAKSIIHRDIKPDNIMILDSGGVKVTDFGLAKSLESTMEITQTGQLMGTPHYMSPEQCDGMEVDFRSDMYSLGATFYRVITGAFPFTGNTPFAVMRKHLQEPLTAPSVVLNEIPAEVSMVIEKMMAKKSQDRYPSYAALSQALIALEQGAPIQPGMDATFAQISTGAMGMGQTIIDSTPPSGSLRPGTAHTLTPDFATGTSPTIVQQPSKKKIMIISAAAAVMVVVAVVVAIVMAGGGKDGSQAGGNTPSVDGPAGGVVDEARMLFEKATKAYTDGDPDRAVTFFTVIINKHPLSEYADKALEFTHRIENEKNAAEKGVKDVQGLVSLFKIEEAEEMLRSLKVDIDANPELKKLSKRIEELKGPVNDILMITKMAKTYLDESDFAKAADKAKQAISKAEEIGYGTESLKAMLTKAQDMVKDQTGRELGALRAMVEGYMGEFKLDEARKALNGAAGRFGSEIQFVNLQDKMKQLTAAVDEIKGLRTKGLELVSEQNYELAITTFKTASEKAKLIKFTEGQFDELIARAEAGMKAGQDYATSFERARTFLDAQNYIKALEWAQAAGKLKDSREVKQLIAKAEEKIEEIRSRFDRDRRTVDGLVKDRKYQAALDKLAELAAVVITDEQRALIDARKQEIEKLKTDAAAAAAAAAAATARAATDARTLTDKTRGALMVRVEGGAFVMGGDESAPRVAKPAHQVTVSTFYMDVKEVTNREYEQFDPAHKARRLTEADGDDIPVTNVTWEEANAFCAWLSKTEGATYRLPTEAEWEMAARGGKALPYSCGSDFAGKINVASNAPVAFDAFPANPLGFYNLSGNVWEYCVDWFAIYSAADQTDPRGDDPGRFNRRVMRGGSFAAQQPELTSTTIIRNPIAPNQAFPDTGFRCVREMKK